MILTNQALGFLHHRMHHFVLPAVVLWMASASLGWTSASGAVIASGACDMLGTAQLFGGLLMLSPCTRATGALWTSAVLLLTALVAFSGGQWFAAGVATIVGGYALTQSLESLTKVVSDGQGLAAQS